LAMTRNPLLDRLGITHPVILAPMGAGPGTPELAAAVSNAGGLGSLAAAYLSPEQIGRDIRRLRELTDRPFGVNLFAGGHQPSAGCDPAPMLAAMEEVHRRLRLGPPVAPPEPANRFAEELEAVLEARPPVFSFTFGVPAPAQMARLRAAGIVILGTATTVEEARILRDAGVDGVVAQGAEAGAHRGTFAGAFEASMVPVADLVAGIAGFAPVIAAGGMMDGRDIARMLALGASAAQLGTAFLACPESAAPDAYKRALLASKEDTTEITRAFSGRPARGLTNTFMEMLRGREEVILPFPLQNALTRPMRAAAAAQGEAGYLSLWAGQGVARCRALPAGELVLRLVEEMDAAGRGAL
jgi:nitronate monooxygenase